MAKGIESGGENRQTRCVAARAAAHQRLPLAPFTVPCALKFRHNFHEESSPADFSRKSESPMPDAGSDITVLLRAYSAGDPGVLDRILPLVYEQLRGLAHQYMRRERPGHTLHTTDLVHEAYLQMARADTSFEDRAHFMAIAAMTMRHILVNHAKASQRVKRGGPRAGLETISIEEALLVQTELDLPVGILDLNEALDRLAQQDERMAKVVEMHYFGGMSYDESAAALMVSARTVNRDLRFAKAWLRQTLTAAQA
jgi:RNA polymerase sigma factor (TIGR02999 family)